MRLLGMLAADAVRDRIGPDPLARLIGAGMGLVAKAFDCALGTPLDAIDHNLYDGGPDEN